MAAIANLPGPFLPLSSCCPAAAYANRCLIYTIISYFVFVIIAAFTTFDYVWIMTQGGPAGSTEVFATRIYKTTFINYDAGYGAAMSLSVCILALSVYFVLKFIQKRGRE